MLTYTSCNPMREPKGGEVQYHKVAYGRSEETHISEALARYIAEGLDVNIIAFQKGDDEENRLQREVDPTKVNHIIYLDGSSAVLLERSIHQKITAQINHTNLFRANDWHDTDGVSSRSFGGESAAKAVYDTIIKLSSSLQSAMPAKIRLIKETTTGTNETRILVEIPTSLRTNLASMKITSPGYGVKR